MVAGTTKVTISAGDESVTLEPGELAELARAAQDDDTDPFPEDHTPDPDDEAAWDAADPKADRADHQDKPKTRASRTAPISDRTKARIRKLAREGMSRNAVARECKVSTTTVSRVCADAKPPITFDRSATAVAVAAAVIDLKAKRVDEAYESIRLAEQFRQRMFEERTVRTTDGNGQVVEYQVDPSARDWKDAMTAYGIALDKHLALIRFDSDDRDLPAVDQFLAAISGGKLA